MEIDEYSSSYVWKKRRAGSPHLKAMNELVNHHLPKFIINYSL